MALGRSAADPGFHELKGDDDTYYKDVNTPNALNNGDRTEGWIWTITCAEDLTDAERAEFAEDTTDVKGSHDALAYAMEKVSMFSRMVEECRTAFIKGYSSNISKNPSESERLVGAMKAGGRLFDLALRAPSSGDFV
ncbi:hypothetical protein C8J57DRAFT_1225977 [Mycena rebaudengoi]|nr:hypothetical protein C8J57DRAFT_1225977 [Mycena rebaudengoi]